MFSRWPLTARGTGAVALVLPCLILAQRFRLAELVYVAVLLLVLVATSIATLYVARTTEKVIRAFDPDVVAVGGEVSVRLRVEIRSPLPSAQGTWQDALPDGLRGDASGVFPETSSGIGTAAGAVELGYSATALRRGIHTVGPLSVMTTDPFGLARRRHAIGGTLSLTVTPAVIAFAALTDRSGDAGGGMRSATDQPGQGTDNLIPRVYVPGDSMRRIHWRASAHRDQLMVRQEEQETTPEAVVVLDRTAEHWSADAARTPGADPGFEVAVSACISAAALLVREGYSVTVLDGDGAHLAEPLDGGDLAAVEQLAIDLSVLRARPGGSLSALVSMFTGASTGPLIVVAGALGEADASALTPLVHHSSLPALLVVAPRGDELARADAAGWRAAALTPGADLATALTEAWTTIVDRGAQRVGI